MGLHDDVHRPMWLFLYATGCRRAEMEQCQWSWIDLEGRSIRFPATNTKTYTEKVVPIADELATVLSALKLKSRGKYVFAQRNGKPVHSGLNKAFRADIKRAGIGPKDVCIHSLRYTFASRLFDLGFSVPEVQKLTGHKNSAVLLEVYSKALDERKRQAVNALFEETGRQRRGLRVRPEIQDRRKCLT